MPLILEGMLEDIRFVFKCAGLSLESRKETVKDAMRLRFIFILNALMTNSDILLCFYFLYGIGNGTSFTEMAYVFPCCTFGSIASIKSIYLAIKKDSINQLIEDMKALEVKLLDERHDMKAIEKNIKNESKFLKYIIKIFYRTHGANLVFFILSPLALILIKYIKTGNFEFRLPILDIYPFAQSSVICWLLKYIKQIYSVCVVLVNNCASDFFLFICCTYLRIQFLLLQHKIEKLIPNNISNDLMRYDTDIRCKLLELIRWHQTLISTSQNLDDIYTQSTLMNFVISSLVICLTGFNVVTVKDLEFVFTFTSFLVLCLLQVFFVCYFGDLLMNSSIELSDSIYNCRWYLVDCAFRKDILIIYTRSQRSCQLTAWGYANVNLDTFVRVLSTSWSYLALLNTMYDQHT